MNSFTKKLEIVSQIAIVIVSIVLTIVLIKNFVLKPSTSASANPSVSSLPASQEGLPVNTKLSIPGVDWTKNKKTLVFGLQIGCHFCSESAPFYQQLARELQGKGLRLVAVLPQSVEQSKSYLDNLGIKVDDIKQASLNSIEVRGTPTLMLVDQEGVVRNVWRGKLKQDGEQDVINHLKAS